MCCMYKYNKSNELNGLFRVHIAEAATATRPNKPEWHYTSPQVLPLGSKKSKVSSFGGGPLSNHPSGQAAIRPV